jgi:hypothetical protein
MVRHEIRWHAEDLLEFAGRTVAQCELIDDSQSNDVGERSVSRSPVSECGSLNTH